MSTQEDDNSGKVSIPKTHITIYGGKKEEVGAEIRNALKLSEEDYYSTWINLGVLKRLGFLFDGGVESAGSLGGLVVMFIVLIAALALFAFWYVTVVFIVVIVLTLLSGGAAFKFLRVTYITKPLDEIDSSHIEDFIRTQVSKGNFVRLEGRRASAKMSGVVQQTSTATLVFRSGIQFSLLIATSLLILEILYFILEGHWLSGLNPVTGPLELMLLLYFGVLFIAGVIIMDLGVIARYRVAHSLAKQSSEA